MVIKKRGIPVDTVSGNKRSQRKTVKLLMKNKNYCIIKVCKNTS